MATAMRRRKPEHFAIHEDPPSTEDVGQEDDEMQEEEDEQDDGEQDDQQSTTSDETGDDAKDVDVNEDMDRLQSAFPDFRRRYRLIKQIGEGTFSTVYKAEDLQYDSYDNNWDLDKENEKWTPPPLRSRRSSSFTIEATSQNRSQSQSQSQQRPNYQQPDRAHKPKYVAIKKIYVTSSPSRIYNELELLFDLRCCEAVCPLITAFRATDQVVAVLPYFRHDDFRHYYRDMKPRDTAIYLRVLFTALASVHARGILHRDIKPTNFLYDPSLRRGVLVDFGLAERQGVDSKPCLCHEPSAIRASRLRAAYNPNTPPNAYPKQDTRPSRRANRAGTRGFRAPEVLFKCTEQTTKIDVWSVGVILLTILAQRFPFFNSADDVEAMIEIASIFGTKRMKAAGHLHGCAFECSIPTISAQGYSLERIVLWSTHRESGTSLSPDEQLAVEFLGRTLELDPRKRISAEEALEHEFLKLGLEDSVESEEESGAEDDDDMDMLQAN